MDEGFLASVVYSARNPSFLSREDTAEDELTTNPHPYSTESLLSEYTSVREAFDVIHADKDSSKENNIKYVSKLSLRNKIAYGFGHVFNDMAAVLEFTYLLLFLQLVVQVPSTYAGIVIKLGQFTAAFSIPVVGILSDHTKLSYGRRKTWHLIGSIIRALSFFFLWHRCLLCPTANNSVPLLNSTNYSNASMQCTVDDEAGPIDWTFLYYGVLFMFAQFGWATTQVSHLALIPELTTDENQRVGLAAIRTAARIVSNLCVFVLVFLLLEVVGNQSEEGINPDDIWIFSGTAIGVVFTGSIFSIIFHVGLKEENLVEKLDSVGTSPASKPKLQWYKWFINPNFYLVAVIYVCTRFVVNIPQSYLTLYLVQSLDLNRYSVAVGPLVIFLSGFVTTLSLKFFNKLLGRYVVYFIGLLLVWGALLWFWLLGPPQTLAQEVFLYGAVILVGAGGATTFVTSLSMVSDLIGEALGSGAFVYGLMTCVDNLSSGILVVIIQSQLPCQCGNQMCCLECRAFYKDVLVFVPGATSLLALIALIPLTVLVFIRTKDWKILFPFIKKCESKRSKAPVKEPITTIN